LIAVEPAGNPDTGEVYQARDVPGVGVLISGAIHPTTGKEARPHPAGFLFGSHAVTTSPGGRPSLDGFDALAQVAMHLVKLSQLVAIGGLVVVDAAQDGRHDPDVIAQAFLPALQCSYAPAHRHKMAHDRQKMARDPLKVDVFRYVVRRRHLLSIAQPAGRGHDSFRGA
jgi:hypothetical protein